MRLLIDTHVLVWALGEPEKLPGYARAAIEDPSNDVFVSAIATWELSIKWSIGKMPLPMSPDSYLQRRIAQTGFRELPILVTHTLAMATLPMHHRDPFDRLLVAQAQVENLTLVSLDKHIKQYAVNVLSG